jgi:ATP-dependent RNA helicase DDX10/DBP4
MKSIYLQKDKTTFDLSQYPAEEFAASMGLPGAPQISFGNQKVKEKKRGGDEVVVPEVEEEEVGRDVVASDDDSDVEEDEDEEDEDISGSEDGGDLEIGSGSEDEDEDDDEPKVSDPLPHHSSSLDTATMMLVNGIDLDEFAQFYHVRQRFRGSLCTT